MCAHSEKYLRRIEDMIIAGEVVDVTALEERERLRVVYNVRRRTKRPMARLYKLVEEQRTDEKGNVIKVKRLHVYLAIKDYIPD